MKKRLLLIVGVLVLVTLACSITEIVGGGDDTTTTQGDNIILTDDFSSSSSGWEVGEYDIGDVGYENGYYFVTSNSNQPMWGASMRNYQDVVIEVDVSQYSGPDNNGFGVVCRLQEEGDGYYFAISGDGYYSISINTDDFYDLVTWESSGAINLGTSTNNMVVSCIGSRLTLEVNGTVLAEATDSTFSSGDIGLFAGTFEENTLAEVHFDNLVLRRP